MLGNKNHKIDVEFLNFIYEEHKKVDFLHVKQESFSQLYAGLKALSKEINMYYENEDSLIELLVLIRKGVNRFFTSIEPYHTVIESDLSSIVQHLAEIKARYENLFVVFGLPIVKSLIAIKNEYHNKNFLFEHIRPYLNSNRKQCIVVRFEGTVVNLDGVPIIKASKFLKAGYFYDDVFFIGSPDFYDSRFSHLFLAKQNYFVTYDFFQNKIRRTKRFDNLKKQQQIDTLFDNTTIARGINGEIASVDFGEIVQEGLVTEEVLNRYKKNAESLKTYEQIEAKLVVLNNKYYTFIPLKTKVRAIDKGQMAISNLTLNELQIGDWILFRNNSNTDLVIDVANKSLGEDHLKYRKYQNAWKSRLKKVIDSNGLEKLIRVLNKKGIKQANLINIQNWLSPTNIRIHPNFENLLYELQFKEHEVKKVTEGMEILNRAHLKAGRIITSELLKELDEEKVEEIIENGYATFTSPLLPGASFNIEEVKEIVDETVIVGRADTLTIWRD